MKSNFKISPATIKTLRTAGVYWDGGLPGFGVRVRDTRPGGVVYVQRYYCRRHQ
jgi:hypothetical protein